MEGESEPRRDCHSKTAVRYAGYARSMGVSACRVRGGLSRRRAHLRGDARASFEHIRIMYPETDVQGKRP
jgi:hypothetical protein